MNVKYVCGVLVVLVFLLGSSTAAADDPPGKEPEASREAETLQQEVERLRREVADMREVIRGLYALLELHEERATRIHVHSRWDENRGPLRFPVEVERAMQGDRFNLPAGERFTPYRRVLPGAVERPIRPLRNPR